jgi:hypothetical protein
MQHDTFQSFTKTQRCRIAAAVNVANVIPSGAKLMDTRDLRKRFHLTHAPEIYEVVDVQIHISEICS